MLSHLKKKQTIFILIFVLLNIILFLYIEAPSKHFNLFSKPFSLINIFSFESFNFFNFPNGNLSLFSYYFFFNILKSILSFFDLSLIQSYKIITILILNIFVFSSYLFLKVNIVKFDISQNYKNLIFLNSFIFVVLNPFYLISIMNIESLSIFLWPLIAYFLHKYFEYSKKKYFYFFLFSYLFLNSINLTYSFIYDFIFLYYQLVYFDKKNIKKILIDISFIFFIKIFLFHQIITSIFFFDYSIINENLLSENFSTNSKFSSFLNIIFGISTQEAFNADLGFNKYPSILLLFKLIYSAIFMFIVLFQRNILLKFSIIFLLIFISSSNTSSPIFYFFEDIANDVYLMNIFRNTFKLIPLIHFLFIFAIFNFYKDNNDKKIIKNLKYFLLIILIPVIFYFHQVSKVFFDNDLIFLKEKVIPVNYLNLHESIDSTDYTLIFPSSYHNYYNWGSYTFDDILNSNTKVFNNGPIDFNLQKIFYVFDYNSNTNVNKTITYNDLINYDDFFCDNLNIYGLSKVLLRKDIKEIYNNVSYDVYKNFFDKIDCLVSTQSNNNYSLYENINYEKNKISVLHLYARLDDNIIVPLDINMKSSISDYMINYISLLDIDTNHYELIANKIDIEDYKNNFLYTTIFMKENTRVVDFFIPEFYRNWLVIVYDNFKIKLLPHTQFKISNILSGIKFECEQCSYDKINIINIGNLFIIFFNILIFIILIILTFFKIHNEK